MDDHLYPIHLGYVCYNVEASFDEAIRPAIEYVQKVRNRPVSIVVVDNASSDATGTLLSRLAQDHPFITVISIVGEQNAAVGRNAILDHCASGHVFMIDSDVHIDPDFIDVAVNEIEKGSADAVYGRLPEILYDTSGQQVSENVDRYRVTARHEPGWFKGVVLLGQDIAQSGLRYNDRYNRLEDIEFSLRVAQRYRILAIPTRMGTHHTIDYHSQWRLTDFVRGGYQVSTGILVRTYLPKPAVLWRIRPAFSGYLFGLFLLAGLCLGLVIGSRTVALSFAGLMIVDLCRVVRRRGVHAYLPLRVVGPLQLMWGFLSQLPASPEHLASVTHVAKVKG